MKLKILSLIGIFVIFFTANAQIDKSRTPKSASFSEITLGKTDKFTLRNGLTVLLLENQKLPEISIALTINNTPRYKGDLAGVSSILGNLLGSGTITYSQDNFKNRARELGANISFSSHGVSASSGIENINEVLELMADGVINAQFTQEEFDKEVKRTLDKIKSDEQSVMKMAERIQNALPYGKNHPYGEFMTEESVNRITLSEVKKEYNTFYKPNNAYLVIIGDFNARKMKKSVKKLFGDWKAGNIPLHTLPEVQNVETTEINFVNMLNATQSEVAVINTVNLTPADDDYFAAVLANQILGGGTSSRLFMNLKEDKDYASESYSKIIQNKYVGSFAAFASVNNAATNLSVAEMMKEINIIRYKGVSKEQLKNAKEQYVSSFVIEAQKSETLAQFILNKEIYNLPDDYYKTYVAKINAVTIDDVQDAAIKYFRGDKARIIIIGKGIAVLKNLERNDDYLIKYFDTFGNPTEKPAMTLPIPDGVTTSTVIDNYVEAIGGVEKVGSVKTMKFVYKASIQGNELELTRKIAAPNKESNVITFGGQVFQQQVFDGEKGYAVQQGRKSDLAGEELETAKKKMLPFEDMAYKSGKLDRIEPINGKMAYVVKVDDVEIFYDVDSGLKVKSVRTANGSQGDIKIPTDFSDYREVNGIMIPHKMDQGMGRFTLNFVLQEIKINEEVEDKDFE